MTLISSMPWQHKISAQGLPQTRRRINAINLMSLEDKWSDVIHMASWRSRFHSWLEYYYFKFRLTWSELGQLYSFQPQGKIWGKCTYLVWKQISSMNNKNVISSLLNLLILIIHNDYGENLLISPFGSAVTHLLLNASKDKCCTKKQSLCLKNTDLVGCTYANIKYLQAPANLSVSFPLRQNINSQVWILQMQKKPDMHF